MQQRAGNRLILRRNFTDLDNGRKGCGFGRKATGSNLLDATPLSIHEEFYRSPYFLRRRKPAIIFQENLTKEASTMATYISLIQFTDQGIRNVKDTIKRGEAAIAEAEKMGMKLIEEFWTMGAYDVVALFEAPDDETVSAFVLKNGALGNAKSQTLRAFRKEEMEGILAKIR
jgi:uncharacterized protein with GYD domain